MTIRLLILADPETLAERASEHLADLLRSHPKGLFCLAAGDTPRQTYGRLAARLRESEFDPSGLRFVALDEWRGLAPNAPGGCRTFLDAAFFGPLGIRPEQVAFFDAQAPDVEADCRRIERWIAAQGPLVAAVLGVGRNGHLGFNEPGTTLEAPTRLVELDPVTRAVGAKYFPDGRVPAQGVTLGLATLFAAQELVLLAQGKDKREIAAAALDPTRFPEVPAALLGLHPNAWVFLDRDAAREGTSNPDSRRTTIRRD